MRAVRDTGSVSVVMLSLLVLSGLLCLATADAANVLLTRARMQNAADAAALAAAVAQWRGGDEEPAEAARDAAERNRAALEACTCGRHDTAAVVTVVGATRVRMLGVAPRQVRATAEARVDVGRMFEAMSGSRSRAAR